MTFPLGGHALRIVVPPQPDQPCDRERGCHRTCERWSENYNDTFVAQGVDTPQPCQCEHHWPEEK